MYFTSCLENIFPKLKVLGIFWKIEPYFSNIGEKGLDVSSNLSWLIFTKLAIHMNAKGKK
jgi:hypothetical protein